MSKCSLLKNIPNETHLKFEIPAKNELDTVVGLYRAAAEMPGCTWNDEYPSYQTAKEDLATGGLYVLRLYNRIIGVVSVVSENELDKFECFAIRNNAREFARITVLPSFCNKGYARYMLYMLTNAAKHSGVAAWHILVAIGNLPAIALYRSFGFTFLDKCEMYGNWYYICEKVL